MPTSTGPTPIRAWRPSRRPRIWRDAPLCTPSAVSKRNSSSKRSWSVAARGGKPIGCFSRTPRSKKGQQMPLWRRKKVQEMHLIKMIKVQEMHLMELEKVQEMHLELVLNPNPKREKSQSACEISRAHT